jgi:glycerol dehydratase small subunit
MNNDQMDYPLSKHAEKLRSNTGKKVSELTFENAVSGKINYDDFKISPETLRLQSEIARANNREQLAKNLKRAAELVNIPNEIILNIYNLLRPSNANKDKLLEVCDMLEKKYGARENAQLIREAIKVYEQKNIFKNEADDE